jgi:hypothetical protein
MTGGRLPGAQVAGRVGDASRGDEHEGLIWSVGPKLEKSGSWRRAQTDQRLMWGVRLASMMRAFFDELLKSHTRVIDAASFDCRGRRKPRTRACIPMNQFTPISAGDGAGERASETRTGDRRGSG